MTIISIIPKGYTFDNYILTIPNTNPFINDLSYIYGSYIVSSSSTDSSINNLPIMYSIIVRIHIGNRKRWIK
jgi:hypothetical protein